MQSVNVGISQNLLQNPTGTPATGSLPAATYVSADQQNLGRKGIKVFVNITAGAGTLTVTIQGKDPNSGTYYTILASAALSGNGMTVLTVYPAAPATANLSANDVLPDTWRISAVVGTNPVTATIGASVIL